MRTKKTVVVLVSGKAGSGKSTLATKLREKLENELSMDTMLYAFANPIKYIASAFGEWDGKKDEEGRKFLQQIGRIFRDYKEEIWVKHMLNQLDKQSGMFPKNFVLVDDWRFPNELAYLRKNPLLDIITIRVFGRGGLEGDTALDVSENSLPEISEEYINGDVKTVLGTESQKIYDFQIENSGDLELLNHKLDVVLAEIRKQYIVE